MAGVIHHLIETMQEIAGSYPYCDEVIVHRTEMLALCKAIEVKADSVPSKWRQQEEFVVGAFKQNYPIYAMINNLSKSSKYSRARCRMAAHAILSVYARRVLGSSTEHALIIPKANIQAGCREVRLLDAEEIDQFGDVDSHSSVFYRKLDACIRLNPQKVSDDVIRRLGNLKQLIALSLGIKRPGWGVSSASGPRVYIETSWRRIDVDDGRTSTDLLAIAALSPSDGPTLHESAKEGLATCDVISSNTLHHLNTRYSSKSGKTPTYGLYQQRAIVNQVKRGAQLLPGRWDQLTDLDWKVFLEWALRDISAEKLALLLCAFTGRYLYQVESTRFYELNDDCPMLKHKDGLSLCAESQTWVSKPNLPKRQRPMQADWKRNCTLTTDNLVLPIPSVLWRAIREFLGAKSDRPDQNLFTSAERRGLEQRAREALLKESKRQSARLTLKRIEHHLFNRLVSGGGDSADAAIITSMSLPYGQSTALYYYQTSFAHLSDVYLNAIAGMEGMQAGGAVAAQQLHFNESSIGSPFYPKAYRLPLLVSDLIALVKHQQMMPVIGKSLAKLHNAYTIYTAFFVAYATGYRSVKFPFSRDSDFDDESGFLVIADKVGDDMSHSRLIPIAPIFKRHLELYRAYRRALIHRLWGLRKQPEPEHFLFFLKESNAEVTPVTPQKMMYYVGEAYNLPLNCNRHFLRSELREYELPGELVDVFMGHWSHGQEPHGKFSSFDYREYRDRVSRTMNRILVKMGWQPLEVLL